MCVCVATLTEKRGHKLKKNKNGLKVGKGRGKLRNYNLTPNIK